MKVLWVLMNYDPLLFSLKRKSGQQHRQVAQWEEVIRHAECAEKGGKHVRALSEGATIVYSSQKARQMQSWSEDLELPFLGEQATRVPGSPRPSRKGKRISPDSLTSLSTDSWLVGNNETQCWDSISLADETHWETHAETQLVSWLVIKKTYWTETPIWYFIKHNCVFETCDEETYIQSRNYNSWNKQKKRPTHTVGHESC